MKNKMYQVIVKHYICDVSWSELDNEWVITCKKFPGFSVLGKGINNAIDEAEIAIDLFIDDLLCDGYVLPLKDV
jgi:predicted RNase H-like HicB family nuclease